MKRLFLLVILILAIACTEQKHKAQMQKSDYPIGTVSGKTNDVCVNGQLSLWSGPEIYGPANRSDFCVRKDKYGNCTAVTTGSLDACVNQKVEIRDSALSGGNLIHYVRTIGDDVTKIGWLQDKFIENIK